MTRSVFVALIMAVLAPVAQAKSVECYCTDTQGSRVELGQTVCRFVDGKSFMAQCQMSLNNPMWRRLQEGCLSSDAGGMSHPAEPLLQSTPVHPKV